MDEIEQRLDDMYRQDPEMAAWLLTTMDVDDMTPEDRHWFLAEPETVDA